VGVSELYELQDFSGTIGAAGGAGAGVTGLYGVMTLGGWPEGLATTFFGFFFSLPRASRLPMKYSSPYFDAGFPALVSCNPVSPRNLVGDDFPRINRYCWCDSIGWYPFFVAIRKIFVNSASFGP
jgi:hypothetical protein